MRYRHKKRINYNKMLKIKHNKRQFKVHNEQMSKYDIENLAELIKNIDFDSLKISEHVIKKHDKKFTKELFVNSLIRNLDNIEENIIEYNETFVNIEHKRIIDKRILIRDDADFDGYNLCFVLSLITNEIVTAYWVEPNFNHDKFMNWKRYDSVFYISV